VKYPTWASRLSAKPSIPRFPIARNPILPLANRPASSANPRPVSFDSRHFAATMRAMQKILLTAFTAAALFALGACTHGKKKSTAHIYAGDAPTIKFSDKPESAGGHLNAY
jgi:hypothetical protein